MSVKDYIRTIPDFPSPGIMFRDVTTLFGDPRGFRMAVDLLLHPWAGVRIDKVAGLEARGFILGGAVAHQLSAGFVPCRAAPSSRATPSNTAPRRSRSTTTPSSPARRSSSWTTSWRPGARPSPASP